MAWTEEKPSDPGYYWYRKEEFEVLDVVRVYRKSNPDELYASGAMIQGRAVSVMDGRWAGPISPPNRLEQDE